MSKLLLVGGPLALYAMAVLVRWATGRRPSRHAMNVEVAVLLTVYFLATASLGLFWVANQQLPPFDLHYLFGYATLALVAAHLAYNARIVIAYARRRGGRPTARPEPGEVRKLAGRALGAAALLAVTFYVGMRSGAPRLVVPANGPASAVDGAEGDADAQHVAAVEAYHAMSSHTRSGVVMRAPSVGWTVPVASYVDRGDAPRVPLPPRVELVARGAEEALAGAPRPGAGRVNLASVATVLWAGAGITERRGGFDLRASASSGALFPTELYVLAFAVDGLHRGVFAYAPDEHALVDLGRLAEASAAIGLDPADPPALVLVATSVFRRSGQKYRDRAYRYVLADAGHALGSALVAAGEVGLAQRLVTRFDDQVLASVLGVDGVTEGAVAAVALRPGADGEGVARDAARSRFAPVPLAEVGSLELGATSMAHLATSLALAPIARRATPSTRTPDGPAVALPPIGDLPLDPLAVIGSRRSVRRFEDAPLALADVAAVLRLAAAQRPFASTATEVHLVANRIDGLSPGAYRLAAGGAALHLTRAGDRAAEAGRAALDQDVVALAPAVIVITGDRAAIVADGPRGYRHAFLEAGIIGARLYLTAAGRGLGGCSVGAFYDDEAARLLGVELEEEWPVHFFALGPGGS